MRQYTIAFAVALVAGCGARGSTTVTTSSAPPSPDGGGGGGTGAPGAPGGGGGGSVDGGGPADGGAGGGGGPVDGGGGGGACTDTTPVAITSAGVNAQAVAVDDSDVYVTSPSMASGESWLWRAPLAGGTAVALGSTGGYGSFATVNATAIFTLDGNGRLLRWAKSGGAPVELQPPVVHASGSCLDDALGYIYVCYDDEQHYSIVRLPEDGGGTAQLVATKIGGGSIAFDAQRLWVSGNGGVTGSAPDGSNTNIFIRVAPAAIAVDDAHLYVAEGDTVWVADKVDGATPTVLGHVLDHAGVVRVYRGEVYVLSDHFDGSSDHSQIARLPVGGGAATVLADVSGAIEAMTVRGDFVYFATFGDGHVYRVCR